MNSDPQQLRNLLDEVIPFTCERCGPNRVKLLAMVQRERARRQRARAAAATLAIAALALFVFWRPVPPQEAAVVTAPPPPPLVIQRVNDQELLALLQDTPAALMEWPNGDRTLLVIAP